MIRDETIRIVVRELAVSHLTREPPTLRRNSSVWCVVLSDFFSSWHVILLWSHLLWNSSKALNVIHPRLDATAIKINYWGVKDRKLEQYKYLWDRLYADIINCPMEGGHEGWQVVESPGQTSYFSCTAMLAALFELYWEAGTLWATLLSQCVNILTVTMLTCRWLAGLLL